MKRMSVPEVPRHLGRGCAARRRVPQARPPSLRDILAWPSRRCRYRGCAV